MEEGDLTHSSNEIRLSALESDGLSKETLQTGVNQSNLPEEDAEDPFASSAGPKEAKTFNELFGAAYDAHLKSVGVKEDEDGASSHQEREALLFARDIRDGSSLAASEFAFARLFKLQTQVGGNNMNVHAMALEGWKSMINAYIRYGSEERLKFFLDTYDAMYGLDARDRALIILKFHCQQSVAPVILETFYQLIDEGEFDDRIFAVAANALARRKKWEAAFKILDDAWMRALANPQFKMTPVFYRSAAEICVRNLNLDRLSDVFIRLNANKPPIDSSFFYTIFRTINSKMGGEHASKSKSKSRSQGPQKDLETSESSTSSPTTSNQGHPKSGSHQRNSKLDRENESSSHSDSKQPLAGLHSSIEDEGFESSFTQQEASGRGLKRESSQSATEIKSSATVATLKSMYDLVEKSMAMHSIQPNTELRNEMIAFKLYAESNIQSMLSVISQYSTKPDTTTLNLLLDALLHERKFSLARTICDAWDAQFGVKLTDASSTLIARYMRNFCQDLIFTASTKSFGRLELASTDMKLIKGVPQFNSIYRDLKAPCLELLDELVSPNQQVKLGASLLPLARLLKSLDEAEVSGAFRGLHSFVLFLETRDLGKLPLDSKTLYEIASMMHIVELPDLGKRITNIAKKHGLNGIALANVIALDIIAAAKNLSVTETKNLWRQGTAEHQIDGSVFALNAYLRTLVPRDFESDPLVAKECRSIVTAIATGKTAFNEQVLQQCLRLLHCCSRVGRLRSTLLIFDLERQRRAHKLPLRAITASLFAVLLRSRTKFALGPVAAEAYCERLANHISDATLGRFADAADAAQQEEFEALMDELETVLPATNHALKDTPPRL